MDGMHDMYPPSQRDAVRSALHKRVTASLIWLAVWLGGSIAFIALRMQIYAMVFSGVVGCVGVFLYFMKVEPLRCYNRFLRDMGSGMRRTVVATFDVFDDTPSIRDGVEFTPMHLIEDEEDRLVYIDASLPRPDFRRGQELEMTTYGNSLCSYRLTEERGA